MAQRIRPARCTSEPAPATITRSPPATEESDSVRAIRAVLRAPSRARHPLQDQGWLRPQIPHRAGEPGSEAAKALSFPAVGTFLKFARHPRLCTNRSLSLKARKPGRLRDAVLQRYHSERL
jgi:hypothetical protein